jgi:predicted DNA-binding WGR domain protein
MSNTTLAGFSGRPLLFLKATVKKKVYIPTYTRHDGVVVPGHWTSVHVADDHDGHKILAGDGTHSQKLAHKALSKHAWFGELPHDHKVHVLLEHATEIQDKASLASKLSTLKSNVLAGKSPTASEIKAFLDAPNEKQEAISKEIAAGGQWHEFANSIVAWQQKNPPTEAAAPVTPESFEAPKPAPESKPEFVPKIIKTSYDGQPVVITELEAGGYKLSVDGVEHGSFTTTNAAQAFAHKLVFDDATNPEPAPVPKVVAAAENSAPAVGPNAKLAALTMAIDAAKLPESNTNAKGVNAKLDAIAKAAAAGDAKTLLMMGYGSNNYGVKATKLANQALAMLGSTHTVTPGQKMASHPGLKDAPAAAPTEPVTVVSATQGAPGTKIPSPAPAPATTPPALPPIPLGIKQSQGVKAMAMAKKGDIAGLTELHDKLLAPKTKAYVGELLAAAKAQAAAAAPAASAALKDPMRSWDFDPVDEGFSGYPSIAWGNVDGFGDSAAAYIVKHDDGFQALYSATGDVTDDAKMEHEDFATPHEAAAWLETTHGVKVPKAALQAIGGAGYEPPKGHGSPAVVSAVESSPKEGETKQGADGMLVFKDGRWHKMGESAGAAASSTQKVSVPVQVFHNTEPGHNKYWSVGVHGTHLVTNYGKMGSKGSSTVKEFSSEANAKTAMQSLIASKLKGGYKAQNVSGAHYSAELPATGTAAAAPAPTAKPAPKVVSAVQAAPKAAPASIDGWTKTGGQQGYNDGGTYVDPQGIAWYCKFPAGGEKVVKNELLASKLYALAGVDAAETKMITQGGKVGIASRIVAGAKQDKDALLAGKAPGLLSGFAVDAWLANWDAVGNNPAKGYDNILIKPDGAAVRIDSGGALLYGGAGGKKQQFTDKVIELKTMLDPKKNAHTAAVFGKMSQADIAASVAKVAAISDDAIKEYCQQYGPGDPTQRERMANTLIARKADMLSQYPHVAKMADKLKAATKKPAAKKVGDVSWVKLKPGEKVVEKGEQFGGSYVKIEVPAKGFNKAGIPQPYVYDKSSSSFVNAQNTADIKSVYDTAITTHDPDAVLGLKYEQIEKATGVKTGKMLTLEEHPSKAYVKEYVNQVAAELKAQTEPTYRIEHRGGFTSTYSAAAKQIASKVKTIGYEKFSKWAHKAADYLVLDKHAGAGIPTPHEEMFHNVEPSDPAMKAFKAASDTNFAKLTEKEKTACQAYTGSAYWNWNSAMRLGTVDSAEFKAGEPMRKAFAKAAVDLPEGIILHRGLNVGGDTYKSVIGAVIQDGSFQSSSYGKKAAFSGKTSQLRLHVTKGVKGMMATTFSGFGSSEREIILHPNCRYVVTGVESKNGQNVVDVLVLPHEE